MNLRVRAPFILFSLLVAPTVFADGEFAAPPEPSFEAAPPSESSFSALKLSQLNDFVGAQVIDYDAKSNVYVLLQNLKLHQRINLSLQDVTLITQGYELRVPRGTIFVSRKTRVQSLFSTQAEPAPLAPAKPALRNPGQSGSPGFTGFRGKSAPPVYIEAAALVGDGLQVSARGQDGSEGGPGGDGGDGADGSTGIDAHTSSGPRYWDKGTGLNIGSRDNYNGATAGQPGGHGGIPGIGGMGGVGGSGGLITLQVGQYVSTSNKEFKVIFDFQAGHDGLRSSTLGADGRPGRGGMGGLIAPAVSNDRVPQQPDGLSPNHARHPAYRSYLKIMNLPPQKNCPSGLSAVGRIRVASSAPGLLPPNLKLVEVLANAASPTAEVPPNAKASPPPAPSAPAENFNQSPENFNQSPDNLELPPDLEDLSLEDDTPLPPSAPKSTPPPKVKLPPAPAPSSATPPPPPPSKKTSGVDDAIPYGIPVIGRPGFVYSPHAKPGSIGEVDVVGIESGKKVRCPYTQKIFKVP